MAKCKYDWPEAGDRHLIGKRISRLDGPEKSSGRAKYTYDVHPAGMLYGKLLTCPHAHARVKSVDTSEAEKRPGVKAVLVIEKPGTEIQWAGDEVAAVAATSEDAADDALRYIHVEYEVLPFLVHEENLSKAGGRAQRSAEERQGDPDKAFQDPEAVMAEGYYGLPVITHCCLETHGNVAEWTGDKLKTWSSTQNVSGLPGDFGKSLRVQGINVQDSNIETVCQYIGGGFGSKFSPDRWGIVAAQLARQTGHPVRLMLDRATELEVAGGRPSAFGKIRVAAKKDGTLTGWQSESWGTGGVGSSGNPPLPYVFDIPNQSKKHTAVAANIGPSRAWRAPNNPQACLLTMAALDDLADKLQMDPLELLHKNAGLAPQDLVTTYRQELEKAAELAEWKKYWHPRGDKTPGHLKRGLGVSLHHWSGRGHPSSCLVTIRPEGSVEVKLGSQDLGTGTRTVIAITVAETLGLPVDAIEVLIGDSAYPQSGASGGSTTVGGVSASTRRAAIDARDQLFAVVAGGLGVQAGQLEAVRERVQVAASVAQPTVPGVEPLTQAKILDLLRNSVPSDRVADLVAKHGINFSPTPEYLSAVERAGGNQVLLNSLRAATPLKGLSWKEACAKLGVRNIEAHGRNPGECKLGDSGVGGVQIADVTVDTETGLVKINRMVAVQDCGLVLDTKTAESQVYGALIMGICYALFEEKIMDAATGRMLNPNMEFYKLAGIGDIGELIVHMMTGPGYDERGVIGLGEPPVISPGAAISNAVANAIGARVPTLPLTPDKVLAAVEKGGTV